MGFLCIVLFISFIPYLRFDKCETGWGHKSQKANHRFYRVQQMYFVSCCTKTEVDIHAPGRSSYRVWCKASEQKVVFPASAEEWSSMVLNWCSDQREREIWAEHPAAPSNTITSGMLGCCSCPSWLMTSPFDPPPHESWQAPGYSKRKHKYKKKCIASQEHADTSVHVYMCEYAYIQSCGKAQWVGF